MRGEKKNIFRLCNDVMYIQIMHRCIIRNITYKIYYSIDKNTIIIIK